MKTSQHKTDIRDEQREAFLGKQGTAKLDKLVRNAVASGQYSVKENGVLKTVRVKR